MPFSFFDHTGDIGVRLDGRTPNEIFRAAALAFAASTTEVAQVAPRDTREFSLDGGALDLLLVDFLGEILYLFDARQFLLCDAEVHLERSLSVESAWRLQATLRGEVFDPARHRITLLVKAVTYHGLEFAEGPAGWHATVVLDV